jgi:phosphoglycerate kinase
MPVTAESMLAWCRQLLGAEPAAPKLLLRDYLSSISRLSALNDIPSGTPVLVRGDVDAKPGSAIGEGDIRLRSIVDTLQHGRQRGWIQVIFGHIGRKPEGSLKVVGKRLEELLGCKAPLVTDWLDEGSLTIRDQVSQQVRGSQPGSVLLLENTRQYKIERALWDTKPDDLHKLAEPLARIANEYAAKIARVYVNEALSAGSLDTSTVVVPAAMDRVALGHYVAGEFDGPMMRCLETQLVVFSGLKIDKLDDLQAMIDRGTIRWVFAAGSLAMALKKGAARLDGQEFGLGVAEDLAHADKPYYIEPARIEQAQRMIAAGRRGGIQFVLPVDFVLQDGRVAEGIGPGDQQFDIGPKTSELFEQKIGEFIGQKQGEIAAGRRPVAFHNGVFGMFEDRRFENGTKRFMPQLKRLKEAGVEIYVGGGEGGAALAQYGQPDWVTHVFTAGGTVLNALGSAPVPYLVALRMASKRSRDG